MLWDDPKAAYMGSRDVFHLKRPNDTMFGNLCLEVVVHYLGVLERSQKILFR